MDCKSSGKHEEVKDGGGGEKKERGGGREERKRVGDERRQGNDRMIEGKKDMKEKKVERESMDEMMEAIK